jgi:hypothetical protein
VVHGVPTRARIPTKFQLTYDNLTLVQIPRWLTRESTEFGLMVSAFAGSVDLNEIIGTKCLWVGGKLCKTLIFNEFSDATQCTNCQLYCHPPALCREKSLTCAVYAQDHNTQSYPYKIPSYQRGPAYTHPPIMCRAYQEPRKASDNGCPAKAKAEVVAISRRASGMRTEENHLTMTHLDLKKNLFMLDKDILHRYLMLVLTIFVYVSLFVNLYIITKIVFWNVTGSHPQFSYI